MDTITSGEEARVGDEIATSRRNGAERHVMLVVEYDGEGFSGWQRQPNGRSVQEVLEGAIERISGHPVRLFSSGRTDAGVHARGMVATFRTTAPHPLTAFTHGVNALLPDDVAVRRAEEVPEHFDPRRHARAKLYRYTILRSPFRSPLMRSRSWHLRREPDVETMRQAAQEFVGFHDFASYRTSGCAARTTTREIFSCTVCAEGELITVDVVGSGFLRNMVRIMVGTLVEIGLGRLPVDHVARTLRYPGLAAGGTAPPQGLCLERVWYDDGFRSCLLPAAPLQPVSGG